MSNNLTKLISKGQSKIKSLHLPKEIEQQLIDSESFSFTFANKELNELAKLIDTDNNEIIKYAASGFDSKGNSVLITCTNERVLIINKNMLIGGDVDSIPLEKINAVTVKQHFATGDLSITNGADTTTLTKIDLQALPTLAGRIRSSLKKAKSGETLGTKDSSNLIEELRQLKELVDEGVITEEEFTAKKKKVLNI